MTQVVYKTKETAKATKAKKGSSKDTLFERLRLLRLKISQEKEVPAYHIFSDASLKQMEKERPMSDDEFLEIDGVGRKKFEDYGYDFIKEIISFRKEKTTVKKKKKTTKKDTLKETFDLYEKGFSFEDIATERKLSLNTIQNHFTKLYQEGYAVNLNEFISERELDMIREAKVKLNNTNSLKEYFLHFEEQMPYDVLKFGLTILHKK